MSNLAQAFRCLMVQGTTSDAGKSTLVAGLCRILARNNIHVAPFKPQNMALNSAVVSGGEIGRAQWLQALAAKTKPTVDMNPVLIKPASDIGAQIIVHGKALSAMDAAEYHSYKPRALEYVVQSYDRLASEFEAIIVEGAGSPAEINLRKGDIANMGFAEHVDCPVILVADIDKGGVFAHIVGTLALLSESEQNRVLGFVINKFRGDISLLEGGLDWLEEKTGKPVFGVMPMIQNLKLDAEDAIETTQTHANSETRLNICVPAIPRISNHTDFDALRYHPNVNFQFVGPHETPPSCDLVILPGSKSVIADMDWLKKQGWSEYLHRHLRYGGKILGICGGMQMLGQSIHDPSLIEGNEVTCDGFRFLPIQTSMNKDKTLKQRSGTLCLDGKKVAVYGYEIHHGSTISDEAIAYLNVLENGEKEGFVSRDNNIAGSYLHGIFDTKEACNAILSWAGLSDNTSVDLAELRELSLEKLANAIEQHIDLNKLSDALTLFWEGKDAS